MSRIAISKADVAIDTNFRAQIVKILGVVHLGF